MPWAGNDSVLSATEGAETQGVIAWRGGRPWWRFRPKVLEAEVFVGGVLVVVAIRDGDGDGAGVPLFLY